ncbi:MAG: AMP-binding protein [Microthrixaceae bacterium]
MNLAGLLDLHPDDRVALISRGRSTTYGELREQVAALRGGLTRLGITPGDRVAVIANNNWYFVVSYLATLGVGAVSVPLNPQTPPAAVATELNSVGAVAAVIGPSARSALDQVTPESVPSLTHRIGAGFEPVGGTTLDDLMSGDPLPMVDVEDSDLAVLVFTSGTAGSPKAAMLTHGNLLVNLRQVAAASDDGPGPDDVGFGLLPMFHIFGLNVVLGVALATGATVVLIERFDPVSALEAIEKHGITMISGPPNMWAAFAGLTGVGADAMSKVRLATSGAAKLAPEVATAMSERYGVQISEGYGLTEASPVVTAGVGMETPVGSVGVPVPGLEMRLVDLDGQDVLVGDAGEIWVRGPNVFGGYWQDQEATNRVLDPEGWLHTGDLAVVDDDGFVYLVDRIKDLIIVSGFNVFPAEVEEVLLEHPAIEAAAVVGVAHPHTGEAVRAYVVARNGFSIEEDDVIEFVASRLARYKCPNKVTFVDEIPVGLGGKVLRKALREESDEATG